MAKLLRRPRVFKPDLPNWWGWFIVFPPYKDSEYEAQWSEATWEGAMLAVAAWYKDGLAGLDKRDREGYPL